jgi:chemotaxis response regulator CheB
MSQEIIAYLREDIKEGFARLSGEIKASEARSRDNADKGFKGCHDRLDKVNGRLDAHTVKIAEGATMTEAHENRIFELTNALINGTGLLGPSDPAMPRQVAQMSAKMKAATVTGASIGGLAVLHSLFEMLKSVGPAILKLFGGG